jgi:protein ImuB
MKPRSVVAVVLPGFRVALVRARSPDLSPREPLAVVVHEKWEERSLSGGTRIDEISNEARDCGVLPGTTIASAKAKCAELRVRVLRPREAARALEALAELLLAFGAITSPLVDRDAVLVDVTGCAHLHGGDDALLSAITGAVVHAGFSCRGVLASGPEIAWALAHAGQRSRVVEAKDTMRTLGELPIDVLRFEPSTLSYFHKLGLSTVAQLRALPRSSLTTRSDNANLVSHVRALLDGEDDTPMTRFQPEEILEERVEIEYGVEQHEALFFVLKPLCDRLSARLQGRSALAARLDVVLELDRAMCRDEARERRITIPLACPLRKSTEIFTVLRSRFEREPPLRGSVVAVALRAPDLAPADERTRHLFEPESRAEIALPKLTAELSALLGEDAVGTLVIVDDWRLERRSKLVSFGAPHPKAGHASCVSSGPEPMRLFSPIVCSASWRLGGHPVEAHLARFEYVAWWRETSLASAIDWKLTWSSDAMAFIEVDARGEARVRGYLD